jgi:hypothetical protein
MTAESEAASALRNVMFSYEELKEEGSGDARWVVL